MRAPGTLLTAVLHLRHTRTTYHALTTGPRTPRQILGVQPLYDRTASGVLNLSTRFGMVFGHWPYMLYAWAFPRFGVYTLHLLRARSQQSIHPLEHAIREMQN